MPFQALCTWMAHTCKHTCTHNSFKRIHVRTRANSRSLMARMRRDRLTADQRYYPAPFVSHTHSLSGQPVSCSWPLTGGPFCLLIASLNSTSDTAHQCFCLLASPVRQLPVYTVTAAWQGRQPASSEFACRRRMSGCGAGAVSISWSIVHSGWAPQRALFRS